MQLSNITIKNDEIQLRQSYAQISMDMRLVNPPNRLVFCTESHIRAKSGQLRNSHFHTFKIWLLTPWVIKPCLCKDKAKGEWFNMPWSSTWLAQQSWQFKGKLEDHLFKWTHTDTVRHYLWPECVMCWSRQQAALAALAHIFFFESKSNLLCHTKSVFCFFQSLSLPLFSLSKYKELLRTINHLDHHTCTSILDNF